MKFKIIIQILLLLLCNNKVIVFDLLMSYEEYMQVKHACPYMYALHKSNQTLFYFGANHSCNPENEQYQLLDIFWNDFLECTQGENSVVLVEGSLRRLCSNKYDAITTAGGEGGLLQFYARKYKINVVCPEPTKEFLDAQLLQEFLEEEIAYLEFSQIALQYHRYRKVDITLEFEVFYQRYKQSLSLDCIKKIHTQLFDKPFDLEDENFFYNNSNPTNTQNRISRVAQARSRMRDEAIISCIADLISEGKNVFVVYGATHAVMQQAPIESLWNV